MADVPSLVRIANNMHDRFLSIGRKSDATAAEKEEAAYLQTASHVIRDAVLELQELRSRLRR